MLTACGDGVIMQGQLDHLDILHDGFFFFIQDIADIFQDDNVRIHHRHIVWFREHETLSHMD